MDLRHLRYFVAVARDLHFGRAAARLNVAQPAVSQQIRALEKDLGARLLNRHSRGTTLTPAGRALFHEAVDLLERAERLAATVRAMGQGLQGVLRINYLSSAPLGPATDIVESFQLRFPDIALTIESGTTAMNLKLLAGGDIDAAFLRPPVEDPVLDGLVVGHDQLVAAIPIRHPLARQRRVLRTRVRKEGIISWPRARGPGLFDAIQSEVFGDVAPKVVCIEPGSEQMARAVARGLGIAILTESRASMLNLPGVAVRRFTPPVPLAPIALAWRRAEDSPLLHRLLGVAREMSPP
jgi:DNA-binding transcriptional LysR family regulator